MPRPWRHPAPAAAAVAGRHGAADLCLREVGDLLPRRFARRAAGSEDLVMRLQIHRKLDRHTGCVNTVGFNEVGDTLISGSDDQMVMLWDWDTGAVKLEFHSGHGGNVFQAQFMPCTDDRTIVSCAADGEVRLAKIQDGGDVSTALLGEHGGRAHNLAIEPGSPYIFYSCGEDGLVQHFDLRTNTATKLFLCRSSLSKSGFSSCVHLNAIAIDPRNPNLFAVGGSNAYARVYDIRKNKWDGSSDFGHPSDCYCPPHLVDNRDVGITGLAFSHLSELLVSYNEENIYLFPKNGGLGSDPKSSIKIGANEGCKSTVAASGQDFAQPAPQLRPRKRRAKLWHIDLPELLIRHFLASERRQQSAEEDSSEDLEDNTGLINLVLRVADGDVSSADDEETSDGSEECGVN
ncbi:DDB1- and CUL4-associated factor 8 [Dichanthelium oligosanthes]|uniref:DDB1-and CUL4-associated factor 8 n=1 Tax=Dichanthelium oligosanthes TaxID=888268 RepID=A0A1E5VDW8_9POAL|nr:DDB1- and CUL4-associated factor 8 [Dichanthelium oligosanthes]